MQQVLTPFSSLCFCKTDILFKLELTASTDWHEVFSISQTPSSKHYFSGKIMMNQRASKTAQTHSS